MHTLGIHHPVIHPMHPGYTPPGIYASLRLSGASSSKVICLPKALGSLSSKVIPVKRGSREPLFPGYSVKRGSREPLRHLCTPWYTSLVCLPVYPSGYTSLVYLPVYLSGCISPYMPPCVPLRVYYPLHASLCTSQGVLYPACLPGTSQGVLYPACLPGTILERDLCAERPPGIGETLKTVMMRRVVPGPWPPVPVPRRELFPFHCWRTVPACPDHQL